MTARFPPAGDGENTNKPTEDELQDESFDGDHRQYARHSRPSASRSNHSDSFPMGSTTPESSHSEPAALASPVSPWRGAIDEEGAKCAQCQRTDSLPRPGEVCRTIRQSAIRDIFVRNGGLNADPEREVSFDRRSERAFVGQSIAHHRSRNDLDANRADSERQPLLPSPVIDPSAVNVANKARQMPCVVMAFCLLFVVVCSAYDSAMVLGASQGFNVSESQDTWTGLKRAASWTVAAVVMASLTTAAEVVCMAVSSFIIFAPYSFRGYTLPRWFDRMCFTVDVCGFGATMGLIFAVVLSMPAQYISCAFLAIFRLVLLVFSLLVNCFGAEHAETIPA